MNSQSNWKVKATHKDRNAKNAFSKSVCKYQNRESENNKSAVPGNSQRSIRQCPSNVLTKNHALQNARNLPTNVYAPPIQHYKSPHHAMENNDPCSSTSPSQSDMIMKKSDGENAYHRNSSIFTSSGGVIHVSLHHGVRIDITVDNSIRLISCADQIIVSLSNKGDASVKHPNGCVQQIDKFVQIVAYDPSRRNNYARYANMCANGISFTSGMLDEVFVLDPIGTRQTAKHFVKLTGDITSTVFLGKSKHNSTSNEEAVQLIEKASMKRNAEDGMDVITINDYRIWQMQDGLVTVTRMSFPFKIRASPMNRSFTLSTPHIHCTASSKESAHLFVRCQDQSMHYDGKNFVVRFNGNSAGFDKNDHLIVY